MPESKRTAAARLIAARAFERAMQANESRLNAQIDAMHECYCGPKKG